MISIITHLHSYLCLGLTLSELGPYSNQTSPKSDRGYNYTLDTLNYKGPQHNYATALPCELALLLSPDGHYGGLKPREVKPVEAERRGQGLRLLARMIARLYAHDIRLVRKVGREPQHGYCHEPETVDPEVGIADLKKCSAKAMEKKA